MYGKRYTSVILDSYVLTSLKFVMDTHLKAPICIQTLENAILAYPELKGTTIHSDRVIQYTSMAYRKAISKYRPHQ